MILIITMYKLILKFVISGRYLCTIFIQKHSNSIPNIYLFLRSICEFCNLILASKGCQSISSSMMYHSHPSNFACGWIIMFSKHELDVLCSEDQFFMVGYSIIHKIVSFSRHRKKETITRSISSIITTIVVFNLGAQKYFHNLLINLQKNI